MGVLLLLSREGEKRCQVHGRSLEAWAVLQRVSRVLRAVCAPGNMGRKACLRGRCPTHVSVREVSVGVSEAFSAKDTSRAAPCGSPLFWGFA